MEVDVDDICDRIFQLVDKNKDCKSKHEENSFYFKPLQIDMFALRFHSESEL